MKCNYMFLTESATMIKSFLLTAKLAKKTKKQKTKTATKAKCSMLLTIRWEPR